MKILHTIHSLDPRSGGPSHTIRHLVQEQVRAGHEVSVLATDVQSAEPWQSSDQYIKQMKNGKEFSDAEIFIGHGYGRRRPWSRYSYSPQCAGWLRRRLSDSRRAPDVVHIHGIFSHVTALAARAARRYSIPYVVRPTGSLDKACFETGRNRLKRLFTRLSLQRDLDHASLLHATSTAEAREIRSLVHHDRICVVPLGINPAAFDAQHAADSLLQSFPQLKGKRVLLYLSRITKKKRPEWAVEALAQLLKDDDDLVLLLAGSDDGGHIDRVWETARLRGVEHAVVHAGFLQGELKAGAFAVSRVFVLPSIDENFAVAVVEAMAYGVPVVVTPGVGSHEHVDRSGGGWTVEDSPEGIADGIQRVLAVSPQEMGRLGRQYVEENLSWRTVTGHLEEVYREAIGGATPQTRRSSQPA